MRVDIMPTVRHNVFVRARARGRIQLRFDLGKLVGRKRAVAEAEGEVVFARHDVDRSCELRRWVQDAGDGEFFAEGVGVFDGDLALEDYKGWVVVD